MKYALPNDYANAATPVDPVDAKKLFDEFGVTVTSGYSTYKIKGDLASDRNPNGGQRFLSHVYNNGRGFFINQTGTWMGISDAISHAERLKRQVELLLALEELGFELAD